MPSVVHGGDELADLLEAPSVIENGGTQAPYGISQNRTIVEEEGEKDGGVMTKFNIKDAVGRTSL